MRTTAELRRGYRAFFESKGHTFHPSWPLIPRPEDRSWWKPFERSVVPMQREDPLRLQLEHFGAVIRGEARPLVTVRDGLANLRITEAIAEAAKSGTVVRL